VSLEGVVVTEGSFLGVAHAVVMELPVTFGIRDCELGMTLEERAVGLVYSDT
jgi:hypothetical protein